MSKHNPDYYMTVEHATDPNWYLSVWSPVTYKRTGHAIIENQIKQLRKYRK